MKLLRDIARWWLNWMSGDALVELDRLRNENCLLRLEIRHTESFSRYVHRMYGKVFEENRKNLLTIARLQDIIRKFEARAGCSLKYLEELEDLRFRLRQYEALEARMHEKLKIPNPPTGAEIGL